MTAAAAPPSAIRASQAWTSGASMVVWPDRLSAATSGVPWATVLR